MPAPKVLIADDEQDILELLTYALEKEGYDVETAQDGEEALRKVNALRPDIVMLDIMMPKIDGIEVCRTLRKDPSHENTIILILTARSEEYSEVAGFDAGADDYVTKPAKLRSLLSRLEALQRRGVKQNPTALQVGPFEIDREKYLIYRGTEEIRLPRKEFELLHLLATQPNKVVTRERILDEIWGNEVIVVDRTIDVHIRRIRIKVGEKYIQTIKGVGYKLVVA